MLREKPVSTHPTNKHSFLVPFPPFVHRSPPSPFWCKNVLFRGINPRGPLAPSAVSETKKKIIYMACSVDHIDAEWSVTGDGRAAEDNIVYKENDREKEKEMRREGDFASDSMRRTRWGKGQFDSEVDPCAGGSENFWCTASLKCDGAAW